MALLIYKHSFCNEYSKIYQFLFYILKHTGNLTFMKNSLSGYLLNQNDSTSKCTYKTFSPKRTHKSYENVKPFQKNHVGEKSYIEKLIGTTNSSSKIQQGLSIRAKEQNKTNKNIQNPTKLLGIEDNFMLNEKQNQKSSQTKKILSNQQLNREKKTTQSLNFIDKHLSKSKKFFLAQTSSHRRFDITKLDFQLGFRKVPEEILMNPMNKNENQYASMVSKSRSNIKKIIQLNRLLKENKDLPKEDSQKKQIERFKEDVQVIEQIKTGCFGTVFKARIISTGKIIAIKSVPYDRQFNQREQQICKIIDNPFIIKIHKVYYSSDVQTSDKKKETEKKNQPGLQFQPNKRHESNTIKSINEISKQPSNLNLRLQSQPYQSQKNLNVASQQHNSIKKSNKLTEHHNEFHRVVNIVMDYYDCDLNDYIMMKNNIDSLTLKLFSYQMLRSLLYLHSHQICHRDIKPHNFLVKKHFVVLTDFGSAKIMKTHRNSNVSYICSRYYRAPELIFGYKHYDKSIDIWSLGCVLAQLCLGKTLFAGANSLDQLVKIISVLGKPNWRKISFMFDKIPKIPDMQPKGLKNIFPKNISPLFIDLLENMLKFNPLQRITAGEALAHSYFDEIRDQINFQQICKEMQISHFLIFSRDQLKQNEHLKNKLIPSWIAQIKKFEGLKSNNFLKS